MGNRRKELFMELVLVMDIWVKCLRCLRCLVVKG
jgi:hypothetical protein